MADITHQIDNEASSRRPDNFIVGVIDEQPQVESAVNELNSLGLPEDAILVLHGEMERYFLVRVMGKHYRLS
jgi:hypothetical protein